MCKKEDTLGNIDSEPTNCVFCKSKDIHADPFSVDGAIASRKVDCDGCERSWQEVFTAKQASTAPLTCPKCFSGDIYCGQLESEGLNVAIAENKCFGCHYCWDIVYEFSYCKPY